MSRPTSEVDICNLALTHLNQGFISNIETPVSPTEVLCAAWYDQSRRSTLRMHPWNFARARTTLSLNATSPAFGYANAYNLPNDFIRLLYIGDDYLPDYRFKYEIEGNQILIDNSDSASLNIGYTKDETSVGKFDALFIEAVALRLALNLAFKITGKNTVIDRLQKQIQELRLEAQAVDGQEVPPKRIQISNFKRAMKGRAYPYNTQYYPVE